MKKVVGIIGANGADRRFFTKNLPDFDLKFYEISDDYKSFDKNITILTVFVDYNVTPDVINALPKLELIATRSTGFDHIDVNYAKSKNIKVANTPGYGKHSVAEYVFALLLSLSRKVELTIDAENEGGAINRHSEQGFDLFNKTIGIIGLGAIGRSVAQIARGFGMNVLAYDPFADKDFTQKNAVQLTQSVDALLKLSDIVTIHIPFTNDNIHFINAEKLDLMKNNAILINTARGELIDTAALVKVLSDGKLGGAALDVIEDEYLLDPAEFLKFVNSDSEQNHAVALRHAASILALERMKNVIVTNHNAFNTTQALREINKMTVSNILGEHIYEI